MRRIFVIFICVVLLFSCNKNNKVQDNKIDNEPVYEQIESHETIIANTSDDDFENDDFEDDDPEYDASENDINSPYSEFFYVWKRYEKNFTNDPYSGEDTYIENIFMTITSKSIKYSSYTKLYYDKNWRDFSRSYTYKYIVENTVWEPITSQEVNNKYGYNEYMLAHFNDIQIKNFPTGYKITGKPKGLEGTQLNDPTAHTLYSDSPPYNMSYIVFLHKDDPSIMLMFSTLSDTVKTSSLFEYHRIDRKKN